jgi:hypothetical protein
MKRRSGPGPNPFPSQTSPTQRFFPTVGDHDRGDGILAGYFDYFHVDPDQPAGRLPAGGHTADQSYYDFELPIDGGAGSIRVFAMDSESFALSDQSQSAQIEWLRTGLTSSTATWNFVVLHRPPFSSGLHNSSPLVQLPFQQWGADVVFSGHDHVYERLRVTDASQNQMLYFVDGLGGANIYSFHKRQTGSERRYNASHGALRATITDESALFEFFAVDDDGDGMPDPTPALIDAYTLVKANTPMPPVLTADFNDDGFVSNADLAIWRAAAQLTGDQGDADNDGDSDGADLLVWQAQVSSFQPIGVFGLTPASVIVPEPGIANLMFFALSLFAPHRRLMPSRF